MSWKRPAKAAAAALVLALAAWGEIEGRRIPVRPNWIEEIHPLLGAAPRDSFAREADADPWADFRGRRFAKKRSAEGRALLVGGVAAVRLADAIEPRLGPTELVLAAREGFGVAQEAILLGRFAPVLDVSRVIAIDGEELVGRDVLNGWTPEWDWQESAIASPIGELLARHSGLARLVFFKEVKTPAPFERLRARYLRGVRSIAALAKGRKLPLAWAFVPPEGLAPDLARDVREAASALVRERGGEAFATTDALLERLGKR